MSSFVYVDPHRNGANGAKEDAYRLLDAANVFGGYGAKVGEVSLAEARRAMNDLGDFGISDEVRSKYGDPLIALASNGDGDKRECAIAFMNVFGIKPPRYKADLERRELEHLFSGWASPQESLTRKMEAGLKELGLGYEVLGRTPQVQHLRVTYQGEHVDIHSNPAHIRRETNGIVALIERHKNKPFYND